MIAERIAEAKRQKQQKLTKLVLIVIGVAVLAALLLYVTSNFSLVRHEASSPHHSSPATSESITQAPRSQDDAASAAASSAADRQAYLDGYQEYENTLKPELKAIDIARWDHALADKLQLLETRAVEAFSAADYATASQDMTTLIKLATDTLERSEQAYEQAIEQIKEAYQALDKEAAQLALNQARMHRSDAEEIAVLATKVDTIPKITAMEEAIRIANVQNEPDKELQAIKTLQQLDPQWGDYEQRAASLSAQLSTDRFNRAISHAYAALNNNQLSTARQQLEQARSISSSRPEVTELAQAISGAERKARLNTAKAAASQAAASDNWAKAETELATALQNAPNDKALTTQLDTAKQIQSLKSEVTELLAHPYRLANESVKTRAKIALIKAEAFADKSPSLTAMANKLESTVEAVNKDVAIELSSDGQTSVSVRGVGTVGTVTSRVIKLKPGPYTFEGKREGFKSKIVEVTIPLDVNTFSLRVVADERI